MGEYLNSRADRLYTQEACREFENRYKAHIGPIDIFGDASGRNLHTTGLSDYSISQNFLYQVGFRKIWLRVPQSNPPVLNRVNKVNAMLTNALGEMRLEVDPRCKELIKDLEEVMFKPDSGIVDKAHDPRRTRASDALGYVILGTIRTTSGGRRKGQTADLRNRQSRAFGESRAP